MNRGDTLAGIAARYAVAPADLRRWNGLAQNHNAVVAGQTLRITSDLAPAASKGKRAGGTRVTKAAPKAKGPAAKPAVVRKDAPVAKAGVAPGG